MGGNIVGVETASRVYYGKPAEELTWAEAALFAVLPNAPSMINVERRRPALVARRNALLSKLFEKGVIDEVTYEASREEPLPDPDTRSPLRGAALRPVRRERVPARASLPDDSR